MSTAKERILLMVEEHRTSKPSFEKFMEKVEEKLKLAVGSQKRISVYANHAGEETVLRRVYEELKGTPGLVVGWHDIPNDPRDLLSSFAYIHVGFEEL